LSHWETHACRRSYGRAAITKAMAGQESQFPGLLPHSGVRGRRDDVAVLALEQPTVVRGAELLDVLPEQTASSPPAS
jgi:hypothetical protein